MRIFEYGTQNETKIYVEGIPLYFKVKDIESYFQSIVPVPKFGSPIRSGESTYSLSLDFLGKEGGSKILERRREIVLELEDPQTLIQKGRGPSKKNSRSFDLQINFFDKKLGLKEARRLLTDSISSQFDLRAKKESINSKKAFKSSSFYIRLFNSKAYLTLLIKRITRVGEEMILMRVELPKYKKPRVKRERAIYKLGRRDSSRVKIAPKSSNNNHGQHQRLATSGLNPKSSQPVFKVNQFIKYECSIKFEGTIYRKTITDRKDWGFE